MSHVTANGIKLEYETFGDRSHAALLLIAGNGAQLFFWEDPFCELLAAKGFFVIRFDNRDVGLSTHFDAAGIPDMMALFQDAVAGKAVQAPYTLDDMADDAVGLLAALGIAKAHICGLSMGGMIAQVVAYRHPEHVLSLTCIMSNTGNPQAPQGNPEALAAVLAPVPDERKAYVAHTIEVWRKIWSPGFPFEEQRARAYMEASYDRCHYPRGALRQNAAIIAQGDRRQGLAAITAPTLVIHGTADPLIPVQAGQEAARIIPGAQLLLIEGMGHDMPTGVWEQVVAAIAGHARSAAA